jgi:hypothetical protein
MRRVVFQTATLDPATLQFLRIGFIIALNSKSFPASGKIPQKYKYIQVQCTRAERQKSIGFRAFPAGGNIVLIINVHRHLLENSPVDSRG